MMKPIYPNGLQALKDRMGFNDEWLGDLVGSSKQTIGKLRNGQRKLTRPWAERIAPHLGVTWAEVMGWNGGDTTSPPSAKPLGPPPQSDLQKLVADAAITGEELALILVWRDLEKPQQQIILRAAGIPFETIIRIT